MKSPDRFLIFIVIGIVVLMLVGLGVAFSQRDATYRPDTSPDNIVYNYLLAIEQREYERAYGYISPDINHYPLLQSFRATVRNEFRPYYSGNKDTFAIEIQNMLIANGTATVQAQITHYYRNLTFSWWYDQSSVRSRDVQFGLVLDENGLWKITYGNEYWISCWHTNVACQ